MKGCAQPFTSVALVVHIRGRLCTKWQGPKSASKLWNLDKCPVLGALINVQLGGEPRSVSSVVHTYIDGWIRAQVSLSH